MSGGESSGEHSPGQNGHVPLPGVNLRHAGASDRGRQGPRRRKRTFSGHSSGRGRSHSVERALADEGIAGSTDEGVQTPPSPPHAPREKQPHLAMPERSGWDFPDDDEEEEDDDEEVSDDSGSEGSHSGDEELPDSIEDQGSPNLIRWPAAQAQPPDPLATLDSAAIDVEAATSEWPPLEENATYLEPPPESTAFFTADNPRSEAMLTDDESLSILERIFILSKSEYREHRAAVTRALPEWIEQVDICEAVEYILPLLNGLAADGEIKIDVNKVLG